MRKFTFILAALLVAATAQAQLVVNGARAFPQANDGTTGTTLNLLATINTSANAILATTANTAVPTYIVVGGAGKTGNAALALSGLAACVMDTTIASGAGGDYVVASTTTAGDCHPQSAVPAAGTWVVGFLAVSSTTAASTALVQVNGFAIGGGGGSHVFTQTSAATNFGTNLTSQVVVSSVPATGVVIVAIQAVQSLVGVGCGTGSNTVSMSVSVIAPGGTGETVNSLHGLTASANGTLDTGSVTAGGNPISVYEMAVQAGSEITYTTSSTLASTGCTTIPQYTVYARVSQ
jgi:hypothetical protein